MPYFHADIVSGGAARINFKNSANRKIMNLGDTLIASAKLIVKNVTKNIFPQIGPNWLQNETTLTNDWLLTQVNTDPKINLGFRLNVLREYKPKTKNTQFICTAKEVKKRQIENDMMEEVSERSTHI